MKTLSISQHVTLTGQLSQFQLFASPLLERLELESKFFDFYCTKINNPDPSRTILKILYNNAVRKANSTKDEFEALNIAVVIAVLTGLQVERHFISLREYRSRCTTLASVFIPENAVKLLNLTFESVKQISLSQLNDSFVQICMNQIVREIPEATPLLKTLLELFIQGYICGIEEYKIQQELNSIAQSLDHMEAESTKMEMEIQYLEAGVKLLMASIKNTTDKINNLGKN